MKKGSIVAVYGPMFAGKTTYLIKQISIWKQQGKSVFVVKPIIDDRYGKASELHAHGGSKIGADLLLALTDVERLKEVTVTQPDWIVIDEAMFFPQDIVKSVKHISDKGTNVLLAGLDLDYRKASFGSMGDLIRIADERVALRSKCADCGEPAAYTRRSIGGAQQIVGAADLYQPVCTTHHTIPIDYPYMRSRRQGGKVIRIEVMADSMRVGKTTAVQVLADGLRNLGYEVHDSYEDWEHNPYLKDSYSDPAKNFLDSQKWFVRRKWEQVRVGAENGIFLQDVAPEMDYCYAATNMRLGRMSQTYFETYDRYFRQLAWEKAPVPDLLVYLQISDSELIKRALSSRREFESVDETYFLTMKQVNREWLAGVVDDYTVVSVDTDVLDFAHNPLAREKLIQIVLERISN